MERNNQAVEIIEKWYKKIGFPRHYDKEFYEALKTITVDTSICVEEYNLKETDGKKNFLYFLYFCEDLERRYKEKGIGEDILM
ncbi:MAG: hypothetical protein IJE40_05340, partial [Clostridia bacterium]|nr:hypothetical protein [Clostridia bacterium]